MFSVRPLWFLAAWLCLFSSAPAQGVRPLRQDMGPEIIIDKYSDVVKASPAFYRIELQNEKVRVLRARIPGRMTSPLYEEQSGLLVAVTNVHLRYATSDGRTVEIQVPAGGTRWIDGDVHSEENLNPGTCEFLFIEAKSR